MPEQLKISFAHSALSDLEDVLEFYKEQKVPHVKEKLVRVWRNERLMALP